MGPTYHVVRLHSLQVGVWLAPTYPLNNRHVDVQRELLALPITYEYRPTYNGKIRS